MQFLVFTRKKGETWFGFYFIPFPLVHPSFFSNFFFLTKTENRIKNGKIKEKITEFTHKILLK